MNTAREGDSAIRSAILTVVIGYAVFGVLWILVSDQAVDWLIRDPSLRLVANTLKGWAFVAITALTIYFWLKSRIGFGTGAPVLLRPSSWRYLRAGAVMVVVGVTMASLYWDVARHRETEAARLRQVADLKTRAIADWLREREGDAKFLQSSRLLAEAYRRWHDQGDPSNRAILLGRLEVFQASKAYHSTLLLDEEADLVWDSTGETRSIDPVLRAAAKDLIAEGRTSFLLLFRDAEGDLHLDFIARLAGLGVQHSAIFVLRADPATYLQPLLQNWPEPGLSRETLLVRREGDRVQYLNEVRTDPRAVGEYQALMSETELLAVRALRGDVEPGSLVSGVDYRGLPALGVAKQVPGLDWFLIAKIDEHEFYAEARRHAMWHLIAGILMLCLIVAGSNFLRQRRALAQSRQERDNQLEKLRLLELLTALVESSEDCIHAKDLEGRFVLVNPAACNILGKPRDQILGRTINELFPEYEAESLAQADRAVIETDQSRVEEQSFMTPLGQKVFLVTKGPLHDESGSVSGVYGMSRDITQRKEMEDSLRKLSLAVEQSPESIVITNVRAEIEYVNAAFTENTGYQFNEVLGRNPKILHSGRTPESTYRAMWATLSEGRPWKGEFCNRRKDGSEYMEFAIVAPIRQADGTVTHYVAVKEDITEKKRIGAELDKHRHHLEELVASRTLELVDARERAEVANQAKSAFLANMSHEIRTPMNAIVGLIHLLRKTRPTIEQSERLTKIAAAADHLLSIINDILDLSKIDAGKLTLASSDFSLAAILDQTHSLIAEQARHKGLEVKVEGDKSALWLRGDPTRIRQALLNFAGNAIKFTDAGVVTLRALVLETRGDRVLIRFEVEDTGIGISPSQLGALFQPFAQVDASMTRAYGGTGLGLAITRRLAEMMDGEAGVESEAGRGSTFWFTAWVERGRGLTEVPAPVPNEEGYAESELRRLHQNAKLLLVDDNAVNREVALELIHAAGLDADTAANGHEAVAMTAATRYDLILMDVQMPLMNGLDATRVIRARQQGAAVPVLAMTANAFEEDRQACRAAGMSDFIAKPVDAVTLYSALLRWLPKTVAAGQSSVREASTAERNEELLQRFMDIPGLDVEQGLQVMRGNVAKYSKLLKLFADTHEGDLERMASLTPDDGGAGLESLAHALKGAAGMMGAHQVFTAAGALVSACRSGADAAELAVLKARLAEDLAVLTRGIRAAIDDIPDADQAPLDSSRSGPVLKRLQELLDAGDMAANYFVRDEAIVLRYALGDAADALFRSIDAFDYEAAANALRPFSS